MNYFTILFNCPSKPRIKGSVKLLFGDLLVRMDQRGFFYDSIDTLHIVNISSLSRVKKWLKILEQNGYIQIASHDNIVELLKNKKMEGLGFGNKICEWCEVKTSVLHAHHYPIAKSKGGKLTVNICPNCHHEFHFDAGYIKILLNEDELSEIQLIKSDYLKSQININNEI